MTERSFFWGGTTVGDATLAPVNARTLSEILAGLTCFPYNGGLATDDPLNLYSSIQLGGVISGYENELFVEYDIGSGEITIDTGSAIVDGRLYINTASIVLGVVVFPGFGTNYYAVYLHKDETAQTVRAIMVGPFANESDMELANTQTDNYVPIAYIAAINTIGPSKLVISDNRRFLRGNVNQVPVILSRQGGDSTYIDVSGVTTYEMNDNIEIITGCVEWDEGASASGVKTFSPLPFINVPNVSVVVYVTPVGTSPIVCAGVYTFEGAANGCVIHINWKTYDGSTATPSFFFMAFVKSGDYLTNYYHANSADPSY